MINGHNYFFNEHQAIIKKDNNLLFLYGDVDIVDSNNRKMLDSDFNAYRESIHEHFKRTEGTPIRETLFVLGELKRTVISRWRSPKSQ